jgi:nucleoside-diphosphate-sugar epimerase
VKDRSRVVIAGCGYLGQAVADLFHQAQWQVEGWTSSQASAGELATKPYRIVACDISHADAVNARAAEVDVVIQCVSSRGGDAEDYERIYLRGAENLLRGFPRATLLFTSSTSVYAQRYGEWVTEESAAEPDRRTARVLRETEELVLARGGIVARVAGIYGPRRSFLLQKFLAGESPIDPQHDRFVNQAHRDDIASALFLLANRSDQLRHGGVSANIFNVVDDAPMLLSDCYEWLAQHLKRPLPPPRAAIAPRKRGDSNKRVSNAKLRRFGWKPRYATFEAAMTESVIPNWLT